MTCIVGVVDPRGTVILGGDSAVINGWTVERATGAKVYELADGWIVGVSGSYALDQAIRYRVTVPEIPFGTDATTLHRVIATDFLDAVRMASRAAGCLEVKDGIESFGDGSLLLGVRMACAPFRAGLFDIGPNLAVLNLTRQGYAAVGAGAVYALGALSATDRQGIGSYERAYLALSAAERHCMGVRGPFDLQQLAPREEES